MTYVILGLILGLVLFCATIQAFILGVKHGKKLSDNKVPEFMRNPVTVVREFKHNNKVEKQRTAEEKKRKQEEQAFMNILTYDGTAQKAVEDEEE